ncbi:TPA: purine-binding chemotaxis protein CheW [Clostridioides difficile]|uniref:chemotaxis protein CheW n=1 Tax=Clostridioides difficile TaxID=1496 RepID=UPI00038D69DB|nr:chemotaxis protein CheW [Clostridioides difficile]EQE74081.1 cheW-like domain protein [Clostridioides difficile CD47]EQH44554.1 cheW-like domain protein [Clostridioides difficile DA00238]EQH67537.1 cheW-like domain protein [Clostridioides difficile DA00273]EQH85500.1 cheW-like domain protein [Clostridioides difficile DA00307]MBY1166023.1 chemotaxis protein CheW [Clostridioides difficile]
MRFPDDPYLDYGLIDEGIKYLKFKVDEQDFGVELEKVIEITGNQEIIFIPELPTYSKGIINLRGKIIPIIDMSLRLKKDELMTTNCMYIVVTEIKDLVVGFVVDRVDDIVSLEKSKISPPPRVTIEYSDYFVSGVGELEGKIITLLDLEKLLTYKDEVLIDELINGFDCTIM